MPSLLLRRDRAHLFTAFLLLMFALAGCMKDEAPRSGAPATASLPAPKEPAPGAGVVAPSEGRAMRITIDTTVTVSHRDEAVAALRASVRTVGGYVAEGVLTGSDDGGSAKFTVKVPVAKLGGFRDTVASLGKVESDSEKAEDVTEARADVKARLHNARATEQRLLDLLANRTGSLGDVVQVEKELGVARESIERMEAEERTLEGQIAFATVNITLDTVYVAKDPSVGARLVEAAKDGVSGARGFVIGSAVVLLSAGPTMVLVGVGLYAAYRASVWMKRRKDAKGAA
jgi:hypothetical protein